MLRTISVRSCRSSDLLASQVLQAVLDCINDRCLVRDESAPDDRFYPRYKLWETDSFAELGADW